MAIDRFNSIVCDVLKIPEERLSDEATVDDVPSWDSLSHMDLIARIEAEFGFELTGDEIADMRSLGAIREIVEKRKRG